VRSGWTKSTTLPSLEPRTWSEVVSVVPLGGHLISKFTISALRDLAISRSASGHPEVASVTA
jgi:hypothetical protein